jgi:hypothetical protein
LINAAIHQGSRRRDSATLDETVGVVKESRMAKGDEARAVSDDREK